jgi:hypothetical protein
MRADRRLLLLLSLTAATLGEVLPARAQTPPAVELEILPLLLSGSGPALLHPRGKPSWLIPCAAAPHPNQQVATALETLGKRPRVIHSTSWRFEGGRLTLTYVALLEREGKLPAGFEARSVKGPAIARGTALKPPPRIPIGAVLGHALRHLAWLARDDEAVRRGLPPGWEAALRPFRPAPFSQLP